MIKLAHLVKLSVFSYENEDGDVILKSLVEFFPFNLGENKIEVKTSMAKGFNERKIMIYELSVSKTALINRFLEKLSEGMGETQKKILLDQIELRLDEDLDFFMRFDKDSWVNERKLVLTDSGKCFHLKISISAFPRKREVALNTIQDFFSV